MDSRIEQWRPEAERIIKKGCVRAVDFSGATYQAEVYDPEEKESYWPFLQFDEKNQLKDAFCSCAAEDGCIHLAAAYLTVYPPDDEPLHLRFESSFWNHLCGLIADHVGYEERFLEKVGESHYRYQNEIVFEIEATTPEAKERLLQMVEKRSRETPENSIKFSNVSQEEINRWREGRPGPTLRYQLSLWADLARWMMALSPQIKFSEDNEGLPTHLAIKSAQWVATLKLRKEDLSQLIPFLNSTKSPLRLMQSSEEKIEKITFDSTQNCFLITHSKTPLEGEKSEKRLFDSWAYQPGVGFYSQNGVSLLGRHRIDAKEAVDFLDRYQELIGQFIPIHPKLVPVKYRIFFDQEWGWHFEAYLFSPDDFKRPGSSYLGRWAYLEGKGFFQLKNPLFDHREVTLSPSEVSHFVNHHRIWLNGQEGFQTHLASIEAHLSYTVDPILRFFAKTAEEAIGGMDFGDWIFYQGLGFFSKKHARHGFTVRPGLEIAAENVSSFIRSNREELENIPHFFTTNLPLASRGLEVRVHSSSSISIKPVHSLAPPYSEEQLHLFGDFVYIAGEGFCEIPLAMRIPDEYASPLVIGQQRLAHFLETELPALKKMIVHMDAALAVPHQHLIAIDYLARTAGGGMKAQLFYQSEHGRVALTNLLESVEQKRRFCFTEAGLIDLQSEFFQWIRGMKNPYHPEAKTIELSTMELIKLDASLGLITPIDNSATAQITRNLIKELREFTSHESPNIKGLKSELRLYQQTGLHWLWFLYRHGLSGLLCDDMGLGKTHQAMALIAATMNQTTTEKRNYLVVCPTSVIYHWQDKLETFLPHLPVHTFHGLKRSLNPNLKDHLILTSYGILRVEQKLLETIPFDVAIFDEIQLAKNPHSRVHEALEKVNARMRIGLTGTPIENNLRELKALFDIVLPGYMPSETRFRELFTNPIEKDGDEEKKALLTQLIRPFVLRRRKVDVLQELPEKSEDKSYCELSPEQSKLYRETLAQHRESLIQELRDQTTAIDFIHIFSLLSRLKQVCDHPALVAKDPAHYKKYDSGKWDLFVELLDEARESDQKVVVFSQFLYMLDIMEAYLKEKKWGYAQIRGDTVNRKEELKRFQEDPSCVVFIGSLQAAGLGIDLTAASVVILYDRWWNAARENQAIDRVHRIGQKWGVQVYKLITKNTIEEWIDLMIAKKGRLLEEVVTADDQALLKKFTRSELIELLTFSEPA